MRCNISQIKSRHGPGLFMTPESIFHSASVWGKLTARNMVSNEKCARGRMSYASEDMVREICLDSDRQIAIAGTFLKHCKREK